MNVTPDTAASIEFRPARLTFRCQAPGDHAKLEPVCPKDQARLFRAEWAADGNTLAMVEFVPPPVAAASPAAVETTEQSALRRAERVAAIRTEWQRLAALDDDELSKAAAAIGVKVDLEEGKEALIDRMVAAAPDAGPPKPDAGDAAPGAAEARAADRAKLKAMSGADLQTEAAVRKVPWDKKASRETMIDRVVAAAAKNAA